MRGWLATAVGVLAVTLAGCQPVTSGGPPHAAHDPGRAGAPGEPRGVPVDVEPAPPLAPLVLPTAPAASVRALPSGARVAIVERRDLPRVSLRLVVAAGTSADGEHAGVAALAAHAVASVLADRAAALGASLEVTVGPDAAVFGLAVHPDDLDAAIAILADVVRAARPGPAEVQKTRARLAAASRRAAAEDDRHAASYVIVRDLYDLPTARHPYGTTSPTAEEIAAVGPVQVRALLAARYVLAAAALVVAGDVVASSVDAASERALGRGPSRPPQGLGLSEPFARDRDRVTVIDRAGASDARVFVGLAAPAADEEVAIVATELALRVAAARLGGGASARMVRFREGPQIAELALPSTVQRSSGDVRRVLDELDRLTETSPTEREVDAAQRALVGETARQLATADGIADLVADGLARAQPDDAIARRLRIVGDATGPIVSIAARGLAEAPAHVVVVGRGEAVGPQLAELAEVKIVDPLAGYARQRSLPQVPR